MKKILSLLLTLMLFLSANAQLNEPGNNLGKSLSSMKQKFPALRYIGTDSKGDQYEDGYLQDGIATFFYFKNGYVVEECMICEARDGFPLEWYKSLVRTYDKNYNSVGKNTKYGREYKFSTFNVYLTYVSENGTNTALIVYEKRNDKSNTNKELIINFSSYNLYTNEKDKYDASGHQEVDATVIIDDKANKACLKLYDSGTKKWYTFNFKIYDRMVLQEGVILFLVYNNVNQEGFIYISTNRPKGLFVDINNFFFNGENICCWMQQGEH